MEERIVGVLEKHYRELIERLDYIEEELKRSREMNEKNYRRLDYFQHKLIALEASLDEKLGLWKNDLGKSYESGTNQTL